MVIEETQLSGVKIITPRRFGDDRGWFSETWNKKTLSDAGIALDFVQDNQSFSAPKGTIRGLHFQSPPHGQDKLVRVLAGSIWDVAVDVRVGSPTYGEWIGVELSADNGKQLLVPIGFLHGFSTLKPDTMVSYKCSDGYAPECDGGVSFSDPDLGIDWRIDLKNAITSDKDANAQSFLNFTSPFKYEG